MYTIYKDRRGRCIIKIVKIETQKVEVVEDVICNMCGKSCKVEIFDGVFSIEAVNVRHSFGYGSKQDMISYEFDLCEDCFMKCVKNLKIEPEVFEY